MIKSKTLKKLLGTESKVHLDSNPRLTKVTINGKEIPIKSIRIEQNIASLPLVTLEFLLKDGMEAECTLIGKELNIDFDKK